MKRFFGPVRYAMLFCALLIGMETSAQTVPNNQSDNATLDAQTRITAIDVLAKHLRSDYVFPDVGEKVARMLEERLARGEYNSVTDGQAFAKLLSTQIFEIAHDGHMGVRYRADLISPNERDRQQQNGYRNANYYFEEIKRLDGNIGYFKLNHFYAAEQTGPILAGAMAFLANTDAMIVDLRDNLGGDQEMVQLVASYFFSGEQPVHLNDIQYRKPGTLEYTVPDQYWVLPYVSGKRYVNKEVFVLTSKNTYSGGEEFSYDLQTLKRATVVGEVTGGAANPPEPVTLTEHLAARIPTGRAVNPITKTNWESVGVKPDIAVRQEDALNVAQKMALEHLLAKTTVEREVQAPKRALSTVQAESPEEQK